MSTPLTPEQAAEYIGVSTHFLRNARYRGTVAGHTPGPAFVKLGHRTVRYQRADLDAWLATHRVQPRQRSAKKR